MSLGDRLGFAGLLVAVIGVALVYLWPDKRWIGWLSLGIAAILAAGWATLEIREKFGSTSASFWGSVLIGAIFGGGAAGLIWQSITSAQRQVPSFGVEVRSAFVSDSGPVTTFMVAYQSMFGNTASPIFYLSYMQVTNLQDVRATISDFRVSVSKEPEGPWEDLVPIPLPTTTLYTLATLTPSPKIIAMTHGTSRLATPMTKDDMKLAAVIETSPALESEIAKTIPPHSPVRGWIALDSLRHVGLSPGQIYFRVKIPDSGKKGGTYVTELHRRVSGDASVDVNCGTIRVVGIRADISGFHVRYYGDPYPTPQRR